MARVKGSFLEVVLGHGLGEFGSSARQGITCSTRSRRIAPTRTNPCSSGLCAEMGPSGNHLWKPFVENDVEKAIHQHQGRCRQESFSRNRRTSTAVRVLNPAPESLDSLENAKRERSPGGKRNGFPHRGLLYLPPPEPRKCLQALDLRLVVDRARRSAARDRDDGEPLHGRPGDRDDGAARGARKHPTEAAGSRATRPGCSPTGERSRGETDRDRAGSSALRAPLPRSARLRQTV